MSLEAGGWRLEEKKKSEDWRLEAGGKEVWRLEAGGWRKKRGLETGGWRKRSLETGDQDSLQSRGVTRYERPQEVACF